MSGKDELVLVQCENTWHVRSYAAVPTVGSHTGKVCLCSAGALTLHLGVRCDKEAFVTEGKEAVSGLCIRIFEVFVNWRTYLKERSNFPSYTNFFCLFKCVVFQIVWQGWRQHTPQNCWLTLVNLLATRGVEGLLQLASCKALRLHVWLSLV